MLITPQGVMLMTSFSWHAHVYLQRLYVPFYLSLVFFVAALSSHAQRPAFTFEIIDSKDGLPGNTVLCAACDSTGFMWFGTRQDVVRYDGANFQGLYAPVLSRNAAVVALIRLRRGIY